MLGDEPGADGIEDVVVHVRDGIGRLYDLPLKRHRDAPAFGEDVVARLA
jgi:hypothetical protein